MHPFPFGCRLLVLSLLLFPHSGWAVMTITKFTGGDAGEGLVLGTNAPYAYAIAPTVQPSTTLNQGNGPVTFTRTDLTPGLGYSGVTHYFGIAPNYGATANDNSLESIGQQLWFGNNMSVLFSNLNVGTTYELQIILQENFYASDPGLGSHRIWNISTNGAPLLTGFDYITAGGSFAGGSTGLVLRSRVVPSSPILSVNITGSGNPFVNAMSLQTVIPEPGTALLLVLGGAWLLRRRRR